MADAPAVQDQGDQDQGTAVGVRCERVSNRIKTVLDIVSYSRDVNHTHIHGIYTRIAGGMVEGDGRRAR